MVPHQNFSMRATTSFVKSIEAPKFCAQCQMLSQISVKISYFLPTLRPLRQTQSPSLPGKFFLQADHLASQEEHLSKLTPPLPISRCISNRISVYRFLPIVSSCVSLSSLKPVYPTGWGKTFKFMVFKVLENVVANENIESRHFHLCLSLQPNPPPSSCYHPQV